MERLIAPRRSEIEGSGEVNALLVENLKEGLDVQTPLKDVKLEESFIFTNDDGLKEMKLVESAHANKEQSSSERDEVTLEKLEKLDKGAPFEEDRASEVSIEAVNVSSSNEKETEVVPWPDTGMLIGDLNAEKENAADGNRRIEMELKKDEGLNEAKLESKNSVPENSNDLVESVPEMASQINLDFTSNIVEKSTEKSSAPAERSVLCSEEPCHGNKASCKDSKILAGKAGTSSRRMDNATEPSLDAEKSEVAQKNEVCTLDDTCMMFSLLPYCFVYLVLMCSG